MIRTTIGFFALALTILIQSTYAGDEFVILSVEGNDGAKSQKLQLRAGEVARTVKVYDLAFDSFTYEVTYGQSKIFRPQGEPIYGPSELVVTGNIQEGKGFGYVLVRIVKPLSPSIQAGTLQLPNDSDSKVQVFVEKSNDLKTWKPVPSGVFESQDQAQFFRLNSKEIQ